MDHEKINAKGEEQRKNHQRIAVVADIHGNLPALECVIADIRSRSIDHVINLGDHASGPLWPSETVELLRRQPWTQIAGNCDRLVANALPESLGASDRCAYDALGAEQRRWLGALPPLAMVGDSVLAFHGTPSDDSTYLLETVEGTATRLATLSEITQRLAAVEHPVMLCGHSHIPRVVRHGQSLVVNPGSVGLPAYDSGGDAPHTMETGSPDARYAVLESRGASWRVELLSVSYDYRDAVERAEQNGRRDWARALRTGFIV